MADKSPKISEIVPVTSPNTEQVYKRRNIMELSFLKSFISGGIAGVLAKSSVAPIERVKLIFQTSSDQFSYRKGVKCLSDILRTEGLRSLWRGNGLVAVRIFPYSAIQFTVYDSLKYYFQSRKLEGAIYNFTAGSAAGIVSSLTLYPLELTRTRMALLGDMRKFNVLQIMKRTIKQEGFIGLYKGASVAMVGVVVYKGFGFTFYEAIYKANAKLNMSNITLNFTSGAIAGLLGQFISYPMDTVKKRAQVSSNFTEANAARLNLAALIKKIYVKEGIFRGFYKGLTINFIKGPMTNGIAFSTKYYLQNRVFAK